MSLLDRLTRTRLARGTAVGYYALISQLVTQLVSVPVLTASWGLEVYGIWLLLFTVPALLAMADFGLTTVGANAMIEAVTRGEHERAARIHGVLRAMTLAMALILALIALLVLFVVQPHWLSFGQRIPAGEVQSAALYLWLYGLLVLTNGVSLAAYRAADAFALSGVHYFTIASVEAVAALSTALAGGSLAQVALAYLVFRALGTAFLTLRVRRLAPWLKQHLWSIDRGELRVLVGPAVSALLYPVANAVVLQGSLIVLGALGGPAIVPAFAITRMLTRTALQFAMRFSVAAMPRYTVAVARHDHARIEQLTALNSAATAALVIPAAILILVFGVPFIGAWTHAAVTPTFALLGLMVAIMLANAAWAPQSNLILAINRHAGFTGFFFGGSIVAVILGYFLAQRWGAEGMAAALLLLELVMVWRIWQQTRRLSLIETGALRRGLAGAAHELLSNGVQTREQP